MKHSLINKFLKFSYGSWIGLLLGLATTMITTRLLSPDSFGKVAMFDLSLQIGLILVVFGTDQSFVRFFYEEEKEKRGALLYNCLRIPLLTSTFILIIILFLYKQISYFLIGKVDFVFAVILAVGIFAQLLFRYGQLVIRMQQKANLYSLLQIFERTFNLIFILFFFSLLGSNFHVLIYSKIVTLLILVLIALYFGRHLWNIKNLKVKNAKHSQSEIITFGTPFIFTIFITWIFTSFDKIALRQWGDFEELGLYTAAMRLVALVMVLKQTFSTFWTPIAYEKFENNPSDKMFYRHITILVSFGMFLVAIASIAGKDVIVLLLGNDYHGAASIMPFLVFMPILYTISETTVIGINFYKKSKWHIFIALVACLTNIVGNWMLVPDFGALGASLSTAFSYVIFFILRTSMSLKLFKVNYPLGKIYFMLITIMFYAVYSIFNSNIILNIMIGISLTSILILLYFKDLIYIYKNRKVILG